LIGAAGLLLAGAAFALPQPVPGENAFKRVLILHSFSPDYFPDLDRELKAELARYQPERVEVFDVPLDIARLSDTKMEAPFVDYVRALFAEDRLDLVVAVAVPAARFWWKHREDLFPEVPLLLAGVETRVIADLPTEKNTATVPITVDFASAVEHILLLAPGTTEIFVVLGRSSVSKLWLEVGGKELETMADRVRVTWLQNLPLDELLKRVAALPPDTAVLFGEYATDAGVVDDRDRALASVTRVSNAPVFGLFESQLGTGIVGGPLLSEAEIGSRAGAVANRILRGEAPESIESAPVTAGGAVYNFAALTRWRIPESLLPPGSSVVNRPHSVWREYRGGLGMGLCVFLLQSALIGGLLVQRSRRRLAEEESRALARRLITAHEDERSRLARELHDDLSQRLARLSIDAAKIERSLPGSAEKDSARSMRMDLARLGDDVHALSYQLHPSVLDDLGLSEALKVECAQFSRRESIPAQLTELETPSRLPREMQVCLFRIAQEALRNAARHSRASEVKLSLQTKNGSVELAVSDNGVGFDAARTSFRRSLGHASMRERARLVGGNVEVESFPGRGTRVVVSLPMKRDAS
jgi:signal transduction histidine kinase